MPHGSNEEAQKITLPEAGTERPKRVRLFSKIGRDFLPQVKDRYPFLYLERGRLAVGDGALEWRDSENQTVNVPAASIVCLLLGPGVSVTHEAVKVLTSVNCALAWVGEDGLHFYAFGLSPTADTRNLTRQASLAHNPAKSLAVARRLLAKRFPGEDLTGKTLEELRGIEGYRQRAIYIEKTRQYGIPWPGRVCRPKDQDGNDRVNPALSLCHSLLYALVNAALLALGYSPHIGFLHSGGPLPFTYDVADLYKNDLCLEVVLNLPEHYEYRNITDRFRTRVLELGILRRIGSDVKYALAVEP